MVKFPRRTFFFLLHNYQFSPTEWWKKKLFVFCLLCSFSKMVISKQFLERSKYAVFYRNAENYQYAQWKLNDTLTSKRVISIQNFIFYKTINIKQKSIYICICIKMPSFMYMVNIHVPVHGYYSCTWLISKFIAWYNHPYWSQCIKITDTSLFNSLSLYSL